MRGNGALLTPPRHIAVIMDGNGRWAKSRGFPRKKGHEKGVEAVRELVRSLDDVGLEYLTLYGFSSENWHRPKTEVDDLMGLMRLYFKKDINEIAKNNIRVRIIGSRDNLPRDVIEIINEAERKTAGNSDHHLIVAFNYGGKDEILEAAKQIARAAVSGQVDVDDIDGELFQKYLYTNGIPDPDMVIRTSGEQRLSNFLTWQSAYSEFVFDDVLWPDFTKDHLLAAIAEYNRRDRRFGGRPGEADGHVEATASMSVNGTNG